MTSWRSSMTFKRVLSVMRNSYHNNSWWKCLHTCDKSSSYKTACSNSALTGFYISVKQPATHAVEQWSYSRWSCLSVYLSTLLWPCPSKVCNKVLSECWVCILCISLVSICRGKHEWVVGTCSIRKQSKHSQFSAHLYTQLLQQLSTVVIAYNKQYKFMHVKFCMAYVV